nr:PREDICTED: CD97 antigen-like [Pundamilia nyererei]
MSAVVNIALCPGGFYVYQPMSYPYYQQGYATYHYDCKPDSCGPLAKCMPDGGCNCEDGYEIPQSHLPTPASFGCVDIDECLANICGQYGSCTNTIGSYVCNCNEGFHIQSDATPVCQDLSLVAIGSLSHDSKSSSLSAKEYEMKINLEDLARANNGSVSAAFLTLDGMESILSHQYFKTKNVTEMKYQKMEWSLVCTGKPEKPKVDKMERRCIGELACTVMAGLLHFFIVASFVWMLLEALQLHLLVRKLSQVKVIQRDGLPRPLLYLIGYGVPFVIVGVSALMYSGGYGRTEANVLILFKILAQFVILGCTWILGLYQTNLFFQVAFIVLNSQQGTFLYIVHCVLNKEIRDEYVKWLTCSFNKTREGGSVRNAPSVSEDLDIPQEHRG